MQAHCHIFFRSWLTDALLAGNIYVNIHTAVNPSGEICGQVRAFLDDPSIQPWQAFEKSHLRHVRVNVDTEAAGKEIIQQTGT